MVVGGPYASLCPEDLRGRCDVLFVDEAEETWPQFLRDYAAGAWQAEYVPAEKPELTTAPTPRFDLLKVDRYHALTIQFARGCPFTCEFCDIIVVYGRRPRAKSVQQVIAEVAECHRLGARQVFLVDDNFIGNKKLAKELLRAIAAWSAERGHPIHFNTEVTLNVAQDDELLALLRAAHFNTVFIGIESPRPASLVGDPEDAEPARRPGASVRKVQSYGIQVQAGMIVGFDHDDETIFDEQLRFIQEARIPVSMTGMLQAMPKTPLHARVAAEGRLVGESSGDQFVFSNIMPRSMTRLELYRGYRELVTPCTTSASSGVGRWISCSARAPRSARRPIGRAELALFARIMWRTVIRASPRRAWFTLSLLGHRCCAGRRRSSTPSRSPSCTRRSTTTSTCCAGGSTRRSPSSKRRTAAPPR